MRFSEEPKRKINRVASHATAVKIPWNNSAINREKPLGRSGYRNELLEDAQIPCYQVQFKHGTESFSILVDAATGEILGS